jgi:hypothetical protein
MIRRRELIAGWAAWPLAARAPCSNQLSQMPFDSRCRPFPPDNTVAEAASNN